MRDGDRFASPCECRTSRSLAQRIRAAQIPKRFEECALSEFVCFLRNDGGNAKREWALKACKDFVLNFPSGTDGSGILFTGPLGVGKTHLAIGILRELINERGVRGVFCDYRDLLKQLQNSYNASVDMTEMQVLRPIFDAEVLVLDELGATKPTDWVWDTVAHILNTRYLDKRTTIFTTNFPNLPPRTGVAVGEETLGDRIGERMRSRLTAMCKEVNLVGSDFRLTAGPASVVGPLRG